ncbi:hypothetical protein AVEN_264886-1 [Araneus ventricosus]|uniref:Uncharacterized protein n=1 Tax=Araneus ventricosus TaxID=182803 RepID=A0A4Y2IQ69_ARAVE|nr:hypothetical protein AVEN_264886-1 [Araneus ventricosus]
MWMKKQWNKINEDSTLECCEALSDDDIVSRVTCGSEETRNFEECPQSDVENLFYVDQNNKTSDNCIHAPAAPSQNADFPVVPQTDKFGSYLRALRATALTHPATSSYSPVSNSNDSQNPTVTASGSTQNRYYLRERQNGRVVKK